ncbi:OsmC family peroxiredoxin [Dyella monticola]|uniref:OsmC family peroxiredoxin n=1 Tax=Dyella monticola TaxID=1927958 RepID=A0A370X983_9GAMM|nr:OsmC family protein [Dyella monticola]RDS84830.1 OsmC family peroxiredoxin [Dyella monticola]
MTDKQHHYPVEVVWTGNHGSGTKTYQGYGREHEIRVAGKPAIAGSSDAAFRGDGSKHNPEDMLVAALSSCHMLWYLHLAAVAGVVVTGYVDEAVGVLSERGNDGRFIEAVLRPCVTIGKQSDPDLAKRVHEDAHHACFIANSVNFPVRCEPRIVIESV